MPETIRAAADYSREELQELREQHGSIREAALAIDIPRSTLQHAFERAGLTGTGKVKPRLTLEMVREATLPMNNCRVKAFIDWVERNDSESLPAVLEALAYKKEDLSAPAVMELFRSAGFPEGLIPGRDAIASHRAGTKPCRCKG